MRESIGRALGKRNGIKSKCETPVLSTSNNKTISNVEKAKLLASTFVKIHGSDNLSANAKQTLHCCLHTALHVSVIHWTLFLLQDAISVARWSRGTILASGARGPRFKSRTSPQPCGDSSVNKLFPHKAGALHHLLPPTSVWV